MLDERLRISVDQYRQVLNHAKQLEQLLLKGEPEELREYTRQLQDLQRTAGLHDRELLEDLARDSEHWQAHPLFRERTQLIKQIVEMNNLLLPRIRGMMSVTAAELNQIKESRVAVAGYHPASAKRQKSVRGIG